LFEDEKMEKMASIIHGISDGIKASENVGGVLVIVSTYNGERFLPELIDSVLNQQGVDVHILVRDDGSSDKTVEILKLFSQQHENFDYYRGNNVGVINSFNDLMLRPEVDKYEWVAFCDQDDVWLPDKLYVAVSALQDCVNEDIPLMYCSNLELVDESLNTIGVMRKHVRKYTLPMSTVQNIGTGCTEVFNQTAVQLYRQGIGKRMEMHDYWMTLVCMAFGKVIYDELPHIKYRQHGNNVVGAREKNIVIAVSNINNQDSASRRIEMVQDFIDTYKAIVVAYTKFTNINNNLLNKICVILDPRYRGIDNKVTVGFKVRTIIGKMY
jgi:glycosyltransferase involved in cell wall biosynthesis